MSKYDLNAAFRGWPIPGSALYAGMPNYYSGIPYNPFFVAPGAIVPPKMGFYDLRLGQGGTDPSGNPVIGTGNFGAYEQDPAYPGLDLMSGKDNRSWLPNMAGSVRAPRLLSGKQYWEVKIISVPTNVPSNFTIPGSAEGWQPIDGTSSGPFHTSDSGGYVQIWPSDLNTFYNPVIGLWPMDHTFTQYSIIGLDDPSSKARSIGAVRTSVIDGNDVLVMPSTSATTTSAYTLTNTAPGTGRVAHTYSVATTFQYVCGGTIVYGSHIEIWNSDDSKTYTHDVENQYVFFYEDGVKLVAPFLDGNGNPQPLAGVGLPYDGTATSTGDPAYTRTLPHLYGDLFLAPDITIIDDWLSGLHPWDWTVNKSPDLANAGDPGAAIPFGAGAGNRAPVFKGRADSLAAIKTLGVDLGPTATNSGVWTGVDLGNIANGDTIMLATDCTSRKVWFGKNGAWIGPSADPVDPSAGTGSACLMDGNPDDRNYFPGASYRLGSTHLRFLFRRDQLSYAPPDGFLPYDFWLDSPAFS